MAREQISLSHTHLATVTFLLWKPLWGATCIHRCACYQLPYLDLHSLRNKPSRSLHAPHQGTQVPVVRQRTSCKLSLEHFRVTRYYFSWKKIQRSDCEFFESDRAAMPAPVGRFGWSLKFNRIIIFRAWFYRRRETCLLDDFWLSLSTSSVRLRAGTFHQTHSPRMGFCVSW